MAHVGEMVGLTPAEVLSTCSFYEMFKREPVGRYLIGICTNIVCSLCGADDLLGHAEERLGVRPGGTTADGMFTLEEAQCLAGCGSPPCVQVNYRYVDARTPQRFDTVLDDLRVGRLDGDIPRHGVLCRLAVPQPVGEPTPVESLALRERH
jgi:NADH-quinone oxidoreductase subunit E